MVGWLSQARPPTYARGRSAPHMRFVWPKESLTEQGMFQALRLRSVSIPAVWSRFPWLRP